MLSRPSRNRPGLTLVELLVVLLVGGTALGLVSSISLRQQRVIEDLAQASAASGQLRDAAAILPIDLRALSPAQGDIAAGQARDTSLEFRATIASAVVCDTLGRAIVLAPAGSGSGTFGSIRTSIQAGDTLWLYSPTDTSEAWLPYSIAYAYGTAPGDCTGPGPRLTGADLALDRLVVGLNGPPPLSSAVGFPLRITRPLRYDVYRASDRLWYLGERDWNNNTLRFNVVQPVSGPFLAPSSYGAAFIFLDSGGTVVPTPVADPRSIALVAIDLRAQTPGSVRALGAATTIGARRDSARIVILLRNRR